MIKGTAHICISAKDLDKSVRFYTEALGLNKHFTFIRDGIAFGYYLSLGDGTFIEVFRDAEAVTTEKPLIKHLCLLVDDIDATIAQLNAHGVEASAKKLGMDQSWQSWITDPSGIRIELHQYTPQSSQLTQADCIAKPVG